MVKIVLGRCGCPLAGLVVKECCVPPRYYSECCGLAQPADLCERMLERIREYNKKECHLPQIKSR